MFYGLCGDLLWNDCGGPTAHTVSYISYPWGCCRIRGGIHSGRIYTGLIKKKSQMPRTTFCLQRCCTKAARSRCRLMDKQAWKIIKRLYPDSTQLKSTRGECLQCMMESEMKKRRVRPFGARETSTRDVFGKSIRPMALHSDAGVSARMHHC